MEKNIQENDFNQLDTIDMDIDMDIEDDDFGNVKPTTISADFDDFGNLQIKNSNAINMEMMDDTSSYNQIDMEMDYDPDLYDDFVVKSSSPTTSIKNNDDIDFESEERPLRKETGIFADFGNSDDDDFDIVDGEVVDKNVKTKTNSFGDMFDDDYYEIEPELVSEELLDERKGDMIDQAHIEDDYLARLAKRHAKTNKKGSYNTHFRMGGDPEKEREMLNHDLTPVGNPAHNIVTVSVDGGGDAVGVSAGVSGGCEEAVKPIKKNKLFENLLLITGFSLKPTDNGKLILTDLTDMIPEMECQDEKEAILQLKPYISDAIITPLQYTTKENFKEPEEWVNWYTPDMEKKFPRCKKDIDYCKMIIDQLKK